MTDQTSSAAHQWALINVIKRNISAANLVVFVFQSHGIVMDQMTAMTIAMKKNVDQFPVHPTSTNVTIQNVFSKVSSFSNLNFSRSSSESNFNLCFTF